MEAYIKAVNIVKANSEKFTWFSTFRSNIAVIKMYKIVTKLEKQNRVSELFPLLDDTDCGIWLSHQLVERATIPRNIEDKCFEMVEGYSIQGGSEGYGNKLWLKEWKEKKNRL